MPVAIKGAGRTYQQNERMVLSYGIQFESTKSLQNKPGRWYYEVTHYSGTNFHLAGFLCEGGDFQFYMCGRLSNPHFYLSEKFKAEQDIHMPFEMQEEHTIGLGIDTYKHLFYVFYDKYYAYYQLNRTNSLRKLNARIWGAYDHTTNDEISVNFGAFPFKYNISGFTPWENNQKEKTCYHNLRKGVSPSLNLMIALILC